MAYDFTNRESNKSKKCFIITPIGGKKTKIREMCTATIEKAIRPALTDLGFSESNIYASHQDYTQGDIDAKIVADIIEADVVIANVSGNNANVLYELAIRHFIGKPVVTFASEDTSPAFDISHQRLLQFETINDGDMAILRNEIRNAVEALDAFQPNNIIFRTAESLGYNLVDLASAAESLNSILNLTLFPSAQLALDFGEAEGLIKSYLDNYKEYVAGFIEYKIMLIRSDAIVIFCKFSSQALMSRLMESFYHFLSAIGWAVRE